MRVHEVAKELDVKSKDVVEFLAGEGVEVKAQSSIEDDNIEKVRKHFGGASKSQRLKLMTKKKSQRRLQRSLKKKLKKLLKKKKKRKSHV